MADSEESRRKRLKNTMYCPFCGFCLNSETAICSSCGKNVKSLSVAEPGPSEGKTDESPFESSTDVHILNEKSCFKKKIKPLKDIQVKISVGLMRQKNGVVEPVRGSVLPFVVPPEVDAEQLLQAAEQKMKEFNQNLPAGPYVLLYPDGTKITSLPGTETAFTLKQYKEAVGKGYQRITVYICTVEHFVSHAQDCSHECDASESEVIHTNRSAAEISSADPAHEEHMSRVFDKVMGLGDFADSSRGSATSCKSGGQEDATGADETSEQGEQQPMEEEDSNSSPQEEKQDEAAGQSGFPRDASPPSAPRSSFNVASSEGGGGGSGSAAFDDALDGLPAFGQDEEEEDWHFALPLGSLEDVDLSKANQKRETKPTQQTGGAQGASSAIEPREAEEEEEQEREASSGSAHTSHSSRTETPDNSQDGGALNQAEETEDSQPGEASEAAPIEDSNPPVSPSIKIKDEPIDEGYDAALLPQSSIKQIKEELEQEEELRISSVYSVGGGTNFAPPTIPAAVAAPPPTAILIPSRGAVLQAVTPLAVRPPMQIPTSLPALTPAPLRPSPPAVPGSVRCSGCSKVLLKGQTAFQRKGSTQLFCSTVCLTGHLPPVSKNPNHRSCSLCNREITQPRDMISMPGDDGSPLNFCGQFCLSVFRHTNKTNEKLVEKRPEKKPEKPPEKPVERQADKPFCSVCRAVIRIEHEVTHQGRLHRLCSDACFASWRMMRQLAMNCCESCGLYCSTNSRSCQTLIIDKFQLNFCGPTCIATYRATCKKSVECAYCHKTAVVSATIMELNQKGKVQLYCSSSCVKLSRPPRHVLTDTPFPCCQCKVSAVPQYHLAMVDGTIRNFCSLACVTTYRKSGNPSQPDLTNGTASVKDLSAKEVPKAGPSAKASAVPPIPQDCSSPAPYTGYHPSHTSVPPLVPPYSASSSSAPGQAQAQPPPDPPLKTAEGAGTKVTCHQCSKQFDTIPLLYCHNGRISLFCSKPCSEQFKTAKNILAICHSCKQEKVHYDTISYDQDDMAFCSEKCTGLFKQQVGRTKGQSWRPCAYCGGVSQKMLHSHYGGKMEEFCRPHCMSQYTVLYYGMGRCDSCRNQGHLAEKLQCLGSVRNFCNLHCLLQYCYFHFEISTKNSNSTGTAPQTPHAPTQPHHSSKMNPVIADVVSLANGSATQPCVSANTALTGALPSSSVDGKSLDHASTQTDAMRVPVSRRRQMKNKSVLCRPFTMDQEIMCELPAASSASGALVDSSSQPDRPSAEAPASPAPSHKPQGEPQPCNGVPARLTGRHFMGIRETHSDCRVCSQHKRKRAGEEEEAQKRQKMMEDEEPEKKREEEEKVASSAEEERCGEKDSELRRRQTAYYCKTCSGEPSLCPVPCFELYHTKLIYKTVLELEASAGEEKVKMVMVPVPVPVFIPVPMNMYSQHTPVVMPVPVPIPVPLVVPPQKDVRDAAVQYKTVVAENKQEEESVSCPDQNSPYLKNLQPRVVLPILPKAAQADLPAAAEESAGSSDLYPQLEVSRPASDPPAASTTGQPPSSPLMDLEMDFPESFDQKLTAPQRGVKRSREGSSGRKRSRRRTALPDRSAAAAPPVARLNHLYGVKAWRGWVQQLKKQPQESDSVDVSEDILECDSAQLSFALSRFIREARRPNGAAYSPDSIFYLCLGIQQYLFMKGRIENIFTDELYSQFASEITAMLQLWKPKLQPSGCVVPSRIEESFLWECKQLGAYSPIVLLNTLLFFCTKNFHLTTLAAHSRLSFSNMLWRSKPCSRAGKVHYIQYRRGGEATASSKETGPVRKKPGENKGDMEMLENDSNPLHCPVRLYEFYLSRCPESAKKRSDMFYLQPEQNVHTSSPHWFTSQPLDHSTLQSMLTRILAVREVQLEHQSAASAEGSL